jgi:hypothetical protein
MGEGGLTHPDAVVPAEVLVVDTSFTHSGGCEGVVERS